MVKEEIIASLKKALKKLTPGQILQILGTDPGSKNDIPHYGIKMVIHSSGSLMRPRALQVTILKKDKLA